MMKVTIYRILLPVLLVGFMSTAHAVDCDQESITFYLEKGFTHDQIVKLCDDQGDDRTSQSSGTGMDQDSTNTPPPVSPVVTSVKQQASNENHLYIKLAIEADYVDITDSALIYQRQECYNEMHPSDDGSLFSTNGCGIVRTEISLQGMEIVKVQSGTFLFRDKELIVKSDIKRTIINREDMMKIDKIALDKLMDPNPSEVNIPLRDDFEPPQIAERLKQL